MIFNLADLVAPLPVSEFLDAFRAGRRLHVRAPAKGRFDSLLPWPEAETLIGALAQADKLTVIRNGNAVPKPLYTTGPDKRFSAQAFNVLAAQGISVLIQEIGISVPRIGHLAAAIERELGVRAMVNGYLSIAKGGAFKPHRDTHDVLIAQIHGDKRWQIWQADLANPVDEMAEPAVNDTAPPDQSVELAPGDVLFIPRGEPHCAAVSSGSSLHLTIGLKQMTGLDFIDHVRKAATDNPLLRMNLPRHSGADATAAHEVAVKQALSELIDAASLADFFHNDNLQRRPYLHTAISGVLPVAEDLIGVTLRRRIPMPDVDANQDRQPVTIGGEVYSLSPASIDALRWLLHHGTAPRRALESVLAPRHEQPAIEAALRELLRYGLLAVNAAD